jgi:hypothetical protein
MLSNALRVRSYVVSHVIRGRLQPGLGTRAVHETAFTKKAKTISEIVKKLSAQAADFQHLLSRSAEAPAPSMKVCRTASWMKRADRFGTAF